MTKSTSLKVKKSSERAGTSLSSEFKAKGKKGESPVKRINDKFVVKSDGM